MPTAAESICCHHYQEVLQRMNKVRGTVAAASGRDLTQLQESVKCITDHPGFYDVCLSPYSLEYAAYEFVGQEGRVGDDMANHELMRHLAYRRFVRWTFGFLGRHNRVTLPACVVKAVREMYHSDVYVGFQFPVY